MLDMRLRFGIARLKERRRWLRLAQPWRTRRAQRSKTLTPPSAWFVTTPHQKQFGWISTPGPWPECQAQRLASNAPPCPSPMSASLQPTFADNGAAFLDAPLAGSRPQAEAGQLIFFVGGLEQHLAAAQPLFEQMGAAAHHAGPTGSGSMVKLAVNALFGAQVALLAEMIGVAERFSGDARRAVEIISSTPVASPAVKAAAAAMTAGAFAPAFPIDLVVKDFRLIATSAANLGAEAPLSSATGEIYAHAAGSGFAADNITGVVQLYSQDRLS